MMYGSDDVPDPLDVRALDDVAEVAVGVSVGVAVGAEISATAGASIVILKLVGALWL